jgi:porin
MMSGSFGLWAVFEQQIYRVPKTDNRGIGLFGRVSSSPTNSSLIDLYADAGIEFIGLADARPSDKFGIGAGYAHVSRRAQALDVDFRVFTGLPWPQRSYEGLFTAVYQYEIHEGWTVQPNFQYIFRPGAGATDPLGANPGRLLRNAVVYGMRTTLKF